MPPRIVIVGAGFVGTQTARALALRLRKKADIVLVDPKPFFFFTPRVIDLLAAPHLPKQWIERPLDHLAKKCGFTYIKGRVTSVDRTKKTVSIKRNGNEETEPLAYEKLILCPGSHIYYFDVPGAKTHTCALKVPDDVKRLHAIMDDLLQRADEAPDDLARRELLTFAVVGAGPSGVESLFALKEYIKWWCGKRQKYLAPFTTFSLVQASPQILPGFPLSAVEETLRALQLNGVNVFVGDPVKRITADAIETALGRRIPAQCVIWACGIEPNTPAIHPPVRLDHRGGLMVDHYLRVADSIFGAGDVITYRERNLVIPKNAQTALLMSSAITENVMRSLADRPLLSFRYHSRGNIIYLGWTGVIDFKFFAVKTRLALLLRDFFYRLRMRRIAG